MNRMTFWSMSKVLLFVCFRIMQPMTTRRRWWRSISAVSPVAQWKPIKKGPVIGSKTKDLLWRGDWPTVYLTDQAVDISLNLWFHCWTMLIYSMPILFKTLFFFGLFFSTVTLVLLRATEIPLAQGVNLKVSSNISGSTKWRPLFCPDLFKNAFCSTYIQEIGLNTSSIINIFLSI